MTDSALIGLALQVGRTPAANLDVAAMLAGACMALPAALGVAGAVVVVTEPPDPLSSGVFGSDAAARRLGERQHRADAGPLLDAARGGRVVVTADLTRTGPPEVAVVAAETGLTSSVAVPLLVEGRPAGGLQLLGTRHRPVAAGHVGAVRPLVDVLGARLSDGHAFRRLSGATARTIAHLESAVPIEQATGVLAERYGTDVEESSRFLHSLARNARITLAEMASGVVGGTPRPTEVPAPCNPDRLLVELTAQRVADHPSGRHELRTTRAADPPVGTPRHRLDMS